MHFIEVVKPVITCGAIDMLFNVGIFVAVGTVLLTALPAFVHESVIKYLACVIPKKYSQIIPERASPSSPHHGSIET